MTTPKIEAVAWATLGALTGDPVFDTVAPDDVNLAGWEPLYSQATVDALVGEVERLQQFKTDTLQVRAILGDSPASKLLIELDHLRDRAERAEAEAVRIERENREGWKQAAHWRAEAEANRRDAERLDWLSENGQSIRRRGFASRNLAVWIAGNPGYPQDARSAIDTAMQAAIGKGE